MALTANPKKGNSQLADALDKPMIGNQQAVIAQLTDSTTGTADNTVADVGAAFNQATLNNNFADIIAKVNAALSVLSAHGFMKDS